MRPRTLAEKLGVSQPRVVKFESGKHNPEVDTIINVVLRLGIEFVLDVAAASRKPVLVTAQAQKRGDRLRRCLHCGASSV